MENPSSTVTVEFSDVRGQSKRLGPFQQLRFEGGALVADGIVIARHANHQWQLTEGGSYTRLECNHRLTLHFQAGKDAFSRELGPYGSYSSVDGVGYADGHIFAFYDEQLGDWYSFDLGSHWKVVVLTPS